GPRGRRVRIDPHGQEQSSGQANATAAAKSYRKPECAGRRRISAGSELSELRGAGSFALSRQVSDRKESRMRTSKSGLLVAMLLLVGLDVRAQSISKEPSAAISGKVTIEGVPVAGVPVLLLKSDGPIAATVARGTTDADGNYRVADIPAGQYKVDAFAPAFYYPSSEFFGARGRPISLRDGETADGIDFKLVRGGVITGRVSDSSGKPVVEEDLEAVKIDENGQDSPMPYREEFRTDDRGVYRLYGLEPGRYLVSIGRRSGAFMAGGPHRFYELTFHPGVTERRSAAIVELSSGGEATAI